MQQANTPQVFGAPTAPINAPAKVRPKKYRHTFWWYLKWFFITIQLALFCAIVVTLAIGKGLYDQLSAVVPDTRFMQARNKAEATRVYASDGKTLLAEFKSEQRKWVDINDLKVWKKRGSKMAQEPGLLINATLSIEDSRFYTHPGMDAKRIIKAAYVNFKSGSASQGGSTITEQLAKNVYLTRTKTISRRLQTALLALQLERRFTKDEILELYLNEIFYGNRASGCEAAAQTYFGKSAKDLSVSQAALVAGLPQSPAYLDPFDHFDHALKRQHIVLLEMLQNKKISWGQYRQALKDPYLKYQIAASKQHVLADRAKTDHWKYPYFVSYVRQYLQKQYGWSDEYLTKSGLKIITTLDPKIQNSADAVMTRALSHLPNRKGALLQGALVSIDPWTGHVIAMVGGRDYYDKAHNGEFNRATLARRQPGSSFKPYVYATAMEQGYGPDSKVNDIPLKVWGHEIKNYDFKHRGQLTFKTAMGMSNNVCATRVLMRVGIQNVIEKAHLMGIGTSLPPVPALALGAGEVTPLEHTSAYGVFATHGLRAEETPVERVENSDGQIILEHTHPVLGARVLSPDAANKMWTMLRYVVTSGTGKNAQIPGVDVGGKTGTTSDNHDVWFMGVTPQLVTGVWLGYDKPIDLGYGSAGGKWCAPIWRGFMVSALKEWAHHRPIDKMVEDARSTDQARLIADQNKHYVNVRVCDESGLRATSACPHTHIEQFSTAGGPTGNAPTQYCDIHAPKVSRIRSLDADSSTVSRPKPGDLDYDPATDAQTRPTPVAAVNESGDLSTPARRDAATPTLDNGGADPNDALLDPPSANAAPPTPPTGESVPRHETRRQKRNRLRREATAQTTEARARNDNAPANPDTPSQRPRPEANADDPVILDGGNNSEAPNPIN